MTMTLATVEVDRDVAKQRLSEYRAAIKVDRRREDVLIARGFYHASRGRQVIDLEETVRAGGLDDEGRPRLAVCPANATRCAVRLQWNSADLWFVRDDLRYWPWDTRRSKISTEHVVIDWPGREWKGTDREWSRFFTAIVPIVPPSLRPRSHHRYVGLENFVVLWEAEWSRKAPRDPALLRHIGGNLFVVLSTWDLTELERAVLTSTRR